MENTVMQIRIDSDLKEEASKLYKNLGIDLSTAVRLFFNKSLSVSNLPFDIANVDKNNCKVKCRKKFTVDDLNKYMGIGSQLYVDPSVYDYIKESRSDRN